jgi:hypothetical protein
MMAPFLSHTESTQHTSGPLFTEVRGETVRKAPGGRLSVALRNAQKTIFDPFCLPHGGPIHPWSVTQTPFRTVSEGEFSEVRPPSPGQP